MSWLIADTAVGASPSGLAVTPDGLLLRATGEIKVGNGPRAFGAFLRR